MMFNDDPKGDELIGSVEEQPEWGGRYQMPVLDGDLAVTVHFRDVDGSALAASDFDERRYALDGRWDLGVGLWFEAVLNDKTASDLSLGWTKQIALGTDYTFDWGNGLYVLVEHMVAVVSDDMLGRDEDQSVTAWMLDYPVNVIDTVKLFGSYLWENGRFSTYLNWQRTYDNVVVSIGLFDYPEMPESQSGLPGRNVASGTGVEIVLIYNH